MIFATGKLLYERTSFFVANEERTRCEARCEEYTTIDNCVGKLFVPHEIGMRLFDSESGNACLCRRLLSWAVLTRPLQYPWAVFSGVCLKHGAITMISSMVTVAKKHTGNPLLLLS